MINNKKVVAIIPARAGSKRLPNKNILKLGDKPLIAWSIEACRSSKYIDDIVISSDSEKILKIAGDYQANILLKRPEKLASDTASTNDVIIHSISMLNITRDDIIIVLQPTSPLRTSEDIDSSLELMHDKGVKGVISVSLCEHSPLWCNTLSSDLLMDSFLSPEIKGVRSQDLPPFYRLNGAIYAFEVSKVLENSGISFDRDVCAYIMDRYSSVDIDEMIDFKIAELLIQLKSSDG